MASAVLSFSLITLAIELFSVTVPAAAVADIVAAKKTRNNCN